VDSSLEEGDRKIESRESDIAEANRTARKLAEVNEEFEKELKLAKELAKRNAEEAERAETKMIEAEKDLEIAMLKKKLQEARRVQPGANKDKGAEEAEYATCVEEGKRREAKTEKTYTSVKLNTTGTMAVLEKSMAFADNEGNPKLALESWEEESEKEVHLVKVKTVIPETEEVQVIQSMAAMVTELQDPKIKIDMGCENLAEQKSSAEPMTMVAEMRVRSRNAVMEKTPDRASGACMIKHGVTMISPKRTGAGEQRVKRDDVMLEEVKQILSHSKDGIKMSFKSEWRDDDGIQPRRGGLGRGMLTSYLLENEKKPTTQLESKLKVSWEKLKVSLGIEFPISLFQTEIAL